MSGLEWGLLWVAWVLAGGSPGPATMSIAGTSMQSGRHSGLIIALGILFGSAAWGLAAAAGLSGVMLANAWLFEILRYAGAAYLLWLAVKSLRSALANTPAGGLRPQTGSPFQIFAKGALIHLTNPKAILSWATIYAIVLPATATPAQVFWLFGFLYSGSIIIFLGYAVIFSTPAMVRAYQRSKRWFELIFAGFFGYASLRVLTARIDP